MGWSGSGKTHLICRIIKYFDKNLCGKNIGFKTTVNFVEYAVSIPKENYFNMVKNRYMSLLSRFNDEEIKQGLTEMIEKYANLSNLEFCDRFVFLVAQK